MASFLKDALDYLAGQAANLTKSNATAGGDTDDKNQGKPTQEEMIGAGSTDARSTANITFGTSKPNIPAELIISGDTYDVTQSYSRMNTIYGMSREAYYKQAENNVQTRKNRLSLKQELVSSVSRLVEEPKKDIEAMGEVAELLGQPNKSAQDAGSTTIDFPRTQVG